MKNFGKNFRAVLTHLFSLGAGAPIPPSFPQGRTKTDNNKSKSPSSLRGFAVLCGASPIELCPEVRIGWDVTKQAHPAKERLAHFEPPRNTVLVQIVRIDSGSIVRVGSRHTFYPRNNGPLDVIRYGKQTPDELQQRANPGNGQVFDPATAATSRFKGIPTRVIKLFLRLQTFLTFECAVALSGERLNAKRKPLLWEKLNSEVTLETLHSVTVMGVKA